MSTPAEAFRAAINGGDELMIVKELRTSKAKALIVEDLASGQWFAAYLVPIEELVLEQDWDEPEM